MHDEIVGQVDLAPDLEWLMVSDQIKLDDLLVYLIEEFGGELNLLLGTIFAESSKVEEALIECLVKIVLLRSHYRAGEPVRSWIYSLAIEAAWDMRRKFKFDHYDRKNTKSIFPGLSSSEFDRDIWLKYLPEKPRLAVVLKRYLGCDPKEIAYILEASESKIERDLKLADQVFPTLSADEQPVLKSEHRERIIRLSYKKLVLAQPRNRLRRTVLEMSWVVGALLLVTILTNIYDLRNPESGRQVMQVPFLTPLPTSTNTRMPTPTTRPTIDQQSSSEEIALRYWQRFLNFDTVWVDALIILGGSQAGPTGYTVKRVEFGWDIGSRKMIYLVGPPDGPPEYGLYATNDNYYELDIREGNLVAFSNFDRTRPEAWYYLATLINNLQINNFEGNTSFRALGSARIADRDALLVIVTNSEGVPEVYAWLDSETALPLRQQRFADRDWNRTSLVLDVITNQIKINEPLPEDYFNIVPPQNISFQATLGKWWNKPQVANSLRLMENSINEREGNISPIKGIDPIFYQVKEISNQEGIKYSTEVLVDREFVGEYPMSNPWSVQCERSPDGKRVAFIEDRRFEFGSVIPSQVFHWFSIEDHYQLNTPLPDVDATRFTFSPDSNFLAVHASNEIFLIDLESGEITSLLELTSVDRLVFSDDGRYLGILRNLPGSGGATNIWIIDTLTKKVTDTLQLSPDQDWESQRADIFATRNVDFTKPAFFGLENCR